MKKIIVIGCPGSGKSTFSRQLHTRTGIPLHHLDNMYWNPDKTTVDRGVFCDRLTQLLAQDTWIIDGNYASTLEVRMEACDTVIFLDYPTEVCLDGIRARLGKPRPDMPWTEDAPDEDFLDFIRNFRSESRPKVLSLLHKYADRNIFVFHNRKDADDFLDQYRKTTPTDFRLSGYC